MHIPIGMHVHPDPGAPMRFSARTATRALAARGRNVTEIGGRVMGCERSSEKRQLWIQKKPGVQRRQASRFLAHCLTWRQEAANHHEFRLSDQSMPVGARRQDPAAETFARTACECASMYAVQRAPRIA